MPCGNMNLRCGKGRGCHGLVPLVSTQVFKPMFSRLRRPMCGRSSTFRELRAYFMGLRPALRRCKSSRTNCGPSPPRRTAAGYEQLGHSPTKRNALSEGRRPSAHRAAKPRRKYEKTCVEPNGTSPWHPGKSLAGCSSEREPPRRMAVASRKLSRLHSGLSRKSCVDAQGIRQGEVER